MKSRSLSAPQVGVTLLELLIVLTVLGVLFALAAPPMRQLVQSTRVQSELNRLMTAIIYVRSEAVKRNLPVSMCPSIMAVTGEPVCDGVYANGWIVFTNHDRDRRVDNDDAVIRIFGAFPEGYTLTNRAGTRNASELLTYLPDGSSGRNRTLLVCAPAGPVRASGSLVMNIIGRPRFARNWGDCPTR